MNKTLYLIFICLLLCAGTRLVAQTFDYNRVSGHPRLLMKQGEEQQIRESLKDNPEMQRVYKQIVGEADRLLVCPTLTYKKEGRRLLAVSREALKRIFDLSFVYRMTVMTGCSISCLRKQGEWYVNRFFRKVLLRRTTNNITGS